MTLSPVLAAMMRRAAGHDRSTDFLRVNPSAERSVRAPGWAAPVKDERMSCL
jgi:hypothetical protein